MINLHPSNEILELHWKSTSEDLRDNLLRAQERQKKWYDKNHEPAPELQTGEQCLLDCWNIQTNSPPLKLDQKRFGCFKVVVKVVSSSYRLNLLQQWNIYNVFHVSLLEQYRNPQDPACRLILLPTDMVESKENWVVKEVIDSRTLNKRKRVQFWVLWERFQSEEGTWESWESLKGNAEDAVIQFNWKHPRKPKDCRVRM